MTHRAGRPMINVDAKKIAQLYDQGESLRTLAKKFGVSYATIYDRVLKVHDSNKSKKKEVSA